MPTYIKTGLWETLKTTAPKNWLNLTKLINDIVDSNYKPSILGSLKITDAAPTAQGLYILSDIGTYTNLGGLVTTTGKLNFAYFDGTTWSKVEVALPENNVKIPLWEAKAYSGYVQVMMDNVIYTLPAGSTATASDVPSPYSALWRINCQSVAEFVAGNYKKGQLIYYNKTLYRAKTNTSQTPSNLETSFDWENVSDKEFYVVTYNTSASTTRNSVATRNRRLGMIITYVNASGEQIIEKYIGDSSTLPTSNFGIDVNWVRIPTITDIKTLRPTSAPLVGMIPSSLYQDVNYIFFTNILKSVVFSNVQNIELVKAIKINKTGFNPDYGSINIEVFYNGTAVYTGVSSSEVGIDKVMTTTFSDGTIMTTTWNRPTNSTITSYILDFRSYNIGFAKSVWEPSTTPTSATYPIISNVIGNPLNATLNVNTVTNNGATATFTKKDGYFNVVVNRTEAATSSTAFWNNLKVKLKAGHTYIIGERYRNNSCAIKYSTLYYITSLGKAWNNNSRRDDASDDGYWKTAFISPERKFTVTTSGTYTLDIVVRYGNILTTVQEEYNFDFCPVLVDVTDFPNFDQNNLNTLLTDKGVFFTDLAFTEYSAHSLDKGMKETFIALGDSTTGMMMWQDKLASIKGLKWDAQSNGGYTINGVTYSAMGVGSTWVEPIVTNTTGGYTGQSHYIRARSLKHYKPDLLTIMSSYNGAKGGEHWNLNTSYPKQPDDYGLSALIASGVNSTTRTYNGTYMGEEVVLSSSSTVDTVVPSFAASFFGMVHQIITDLPNCRIILIGLTNYFYGGNSAQIALKNAVIEACAEFYSLTYVDVNTAGFNLLNANAMRYNGGVHFNEAGGLRLARHIASKI